jgi:hypothetical protein
VVLEMTRLVRMATTVAAPRPVGEVGADDWAAVWINPPDSARVWLDVGGRIRDWYEAHDREFARCVTVIRAGSGADRCESGEPLARAVDAIYRPPALDGIAAACQAAAACGEPRLFTARLLARELDRGDAERWGRLRKLGWVAPASSGFSAYLAGVALIQRFVGRDLMFLACGRAPHPRWQPDRGELTFSDVVIKRVTAAKAENVAWLLGEFERQGWPPQIRLPVEMTGERLHQTLRSLNKDLQGMRFRAHDSCAMWELPR